MSGTWELFALRASPLSPKTKQIQTRKRKTLAWKVHCPSGK